MTSVVDTALKEVGYQEGANNANKYSTYLGRPAESWCADFVVWCMHQAGHAGSIINTPSVISMGNWAVKSGLVIDPKDAQAGDIVLFDFTGKKKAPVHVGIVEKGYDPKKNSLRTIEGNTTNAMRGSQSNGDCVAQKERGLSYIYQVFRPKY